MTPGAPVSTPEGFERVVVGEVAVGELRAATLQNGTALCIGNADGVLFAVRDACPHSAFPLSQGQLLPGARLECGWHGAQFDCRRGDVLEGPADEPLALLDVREADGAIWVREPSPA